MRTRDIQAHLTGRVDITLMSIRTEVQIANGPTDRPGRVLDLVVRAKEVTARPSTTHPYLPRVNSPINDNVTVTV